MRLNLNNFFYKALFLCALLYPTLSTAKNTSVRELVQTNVFHATRYVAGVYWSSITPAVLFVLFIVVLAIGVTRYYWTNRKSRDISAD
jgi:hypothetical protein